MEQRLILGDCVDVLPTMAEGLVDAIVCDPPYGLEFMGKNWDKLDIRQPGDGTFHKSGSGPHDRATVRYSSAPSYRGSSFLKIQEWHYRWAVQALRVAKPGAYLLAFGGTRTFHRLACALEDAGWEIRDCILWLYGSGFPKSHDVSKAIDKAAGAERRVVGESRNGTGAQPHKLNAHGPGDTGFGYMDGSGKVFEITEAATDLAKVWQGWGTALKPAWEPIIVAHKPLDGTVSESMAKHGTGAMQRSKQQQTLPL